MYLSMTLDSMGSLGMLLPIYLRKRNKSDALLEVYGICSRLRIVTYDSWLILSRH